MSDKCVLVPRTVLTDKKLSLKAKGLYALILSQPSDQNCSIECLMEEAVEGKDAIRSAIYELEINGYLTRRKISTGGRFCGMEYRLEMI